MILWTYIVHEQTPINMVKEIRLKQFFSQVHTISSSNENFILTLYCVDIKNCEKLNNF